MAADKDNAMNTTEMTTTMPPKAPVGRENVFARLWHVLTHFFKEVEVELRKTSWPTRNELTKFTIVVMVTIVVVSLYLFVSDWVIMQISRVLFHIGT